MFNKVVLGSLALHAVSAFSATPHRSTPPVATAASKTVGDPYHGAFFVEEPVADPELTCFLTPEWMDTPDLSAKQWVCMPSHTEAIKPPNSEDSY